MKEIEITKIFDEGLKNRTISYSDMMQTIIEFRNYDEIVTTFKLLKKTFGAIEEFVSAIDAEISILKKIREDIKQRGESITHAEVERIIYNIFYGSAKNIKVIFLSNIKNQNEFSVSIIIDIYTEFGYKGLQEYINLIRNPRNLTNYLQNVNQQTLAIKFLLYKSGHHSNGRLTRNKRATDIYEVFNENMNASIQEISQGRDEFISFMNSEKKDYVDWKNNVDNEYSTIKNDNKLDFENFMESSNQTIKDLENTYSEKLKLEKPSEFMLEKSKEYDTKVVKWTIATVVLGVVLILLLWMILNPSIEISETIITVNLFSKEIPIYSSIILLTITALIVYILRIFVKMIISSKHLSEEYKQKHILTYFYLSLVNAGEMNESTRNLILSLLFSKSDTGLIKADNGKDIETILSMITSSNK